MYEEGTPPSPNYQMERLKVNCSERKMWNIPENWLKWTIHISYLLPTHMISVFEDYFG
jgi:hypothetical protein